MRRRIVLALDDLDELPQVLEAIRVEARTQGAEPSIIDGKEQVDSFRGAMIASLCRQYLDAVRSPATRVTAINTETPNP
jgi:hypothetical protein